MKNLKYIAILLITLIVSSCEDVVDVTLNTAPPKLVIDASIDWIKGTDGKIQKIKLSTTAGYYDAEVPKVSGAIVKGNGNAVFSFLETPNTGEYICTEFAPVIGEKYELTVVVAGQTYVANERMIASPDINSIEQKNDAGFNGDEIEVKFYFQDNGNEDNNYMTTFETDFIQYPYYAVFDDEFFQGNQSYGSYIHEDLATGNKMKVALYGISKAYLDYMNILLKASQDQSGPWSTTPTNARGNLINRTDAKNFALGYFRLSQVDKRDYTVQ